MSEESAVAKVEQGITDVSAFSDQGAFELAQRQAKMLSVSRLVPDTFRNNIPDCVIALEIAQRIGASALAVMQNLYIVHGKPAWSSQFLVSCINASRKFTPLRYKFSGTKGQKDWGCCAWAKDATGEVLEGPEVTIAMAEAEGWSTKNGSKWKTLPQLMLMYRAATFFARLYAPELTMGIQTEGEIIDVDPIVTEPVYRQPKPLFEQPRPEPESEDDIPMDTPPAEPTDQDLDALFAEIEALEKGPKGPWTRACKAVGIDGDWHVYDSAKLTELRDLLKQ